MCRVLLRARSVLVAVLCIGWCMVFVVRGLLIDVYCVVVGVCCLVSYVVGC